MPLSSLQRYITNKKPHLNHQDNPLLTPSLPPSQPNMNILLTSNQTSFSPLSHGYQTQCTASTCTSI
eukprot:13411502-Ditylum_brightwellii.AAC.1